MPADPGRPAVVQLPLPTAVLWDMDGTLVDTEPYWQAAESALVREYGGTWTDADAHAVMGSPLQISAEYLRVTGGVDLSVPEIVSWLLDEVRERVRRSVPWQPGARELLTLLTTAGVPCALVTQSYRSLADAVLDALPAGTFGAVVTGDQVTHGKPHPEPYQRAADHLGIPASSCLVIEDTPPGVESAIAAGAVAAAVAPVVPVPPGPGRLVLPTLAGTTLDDVRSWNHHLTRSRATTAPGDGS
jgi:HAD superfamily hydrolase (TIGR01509 family)